MKVTVLISLFILLFGCSGDKKLIEIRGETMGTYYRVKLYTSERSDELKSKIDKFLKFYNQIFSTYIKDSELSKINQSQFDNMKISDSMVKILELSREISNKTEGYFDITVGPLVNLWGFGPDGKQKIPSEEVIKEKMSLIGYHKVKIKDERLHRPVGMYIDLSAIAKGFGVDELVKFLEYSGHSQLLVEIGGEVRTRGLKPDGSNWNVGIEGPSSKLGQKLAKVVSLENMSMATSGSYRNFVKYGDEVFNHTINPKTGRPIKHKTISVSVIHEYCADADALATGFMSMGHEKGLIIANRQNFKVLFQVLEGQEVKLLPSESFKKLYP